MRSRSRAVWAIVLVLVAVSTAVIVRARQTRPPNLKPDALAATAPITATDRLLVVAPHCDDEVLGAGGLIRDAAAVGAQVKIILMTNGDGFRYAVETEQKTVRATPAQYIRFAYQRQAETVAAVTSLGASPGTITFLGYPDRGIAELWLAHWPAGNPYRSLFTGYRASPYRNAYTPNAPYTGTQAAQDLADLVAAYKPTIVAYPHPSDAHPDHWATSAFVTYTLERLRSQGEAWADSAHRYLYLVHRGEWPNPKGERLQDRLLPPRTLLNTETRWLLRPMASEAVVAKRDAILKYGSQLAIMRSYLLSFARTTEVYGTLGPAAVPLNGLGRIVTDPAEDTIARLIDPGADLLAVDAGCSAGSLQLHIRVRGEPTRSVTYAVHLIAISNGPIAERIGLNLLLRPPSTVVIGAGSSMATSGAVFSSGERQLSVTVPLSDLGQPRRILAAVTTLIGTDAVDQTVWMTLELGSAATP